MTASTTLIDGATWNEAPGLLSKISLSGISIGWLGLASPNARQWSILCVGQPAFDLRWPYTFHVCAAFFALGTQTLPKVNTVSDGILWT